MHQKMIINIDSPAKLNNLKDGDIIIYDATRKVFYVTTKENLFFREETERQEYQKLVNEKLQQMESIVKTQNEEINKLRENYNDFLIKYKKTNEKVIEMVESVVNSQ